MLDCTLRDGGYCNDCRFGFHNARKIIDNLIAADVDVIECGFLTQKYEYDRDRTRFTTLQEVKNIISADKKGKIFVLLMNYGDYDIDSLPENDGTSVDGIRVAFHKKDMLKALECCRRVAEKGYKLFVQPMVTLSYSDEEFLYLLKKVNEIKPFAFYIVDSFGMMKQKELRHLFYNTEHNLDSSVHIGFHSHNNLQLAYSNAQWLADIKTKFDMIIDCSVYGMGRGAGNLNTELFVQYLNENADSDYKIEPLLKIIDEILNQFYQNSYWGYSLPNYLSAVHNAHPNYASYLDDKKTLTVENMNEIFGMMSEQKRLEFDKAYIEGLYLQYMERKIKHDNGDVDLNKIFSGKTVLLIAPGKSSAEECEKIISFAANHDVLVISINFDYPEYQTDYIFVSNIRRFSKLDSVEKKKCIVTSNIDAGDVFCQTDYEELLFDEEAVKDNAGLMAVKLLMKYHVSELYLAGFDGYSHDTSENYGLDYMTLVNKNIVLDSLNKGMLHVLKAYAKQGCLKFLTTPKFLEV